MNRPHGRAGIFAWDAAGAYLFDIDGTLLNTRDPVQYHAFGHAVREVFGVESSIDGVPVHGNTDIGILKAVLRRAGIPEAEIAEKIPQTVARMCAEVRANAADMRVDVCPAIEDMLERLRNAGRLLGIVSGNLETIGWAKVQAAGLRGYFDFGSFSDRNEMRADIFRHGLAEARRRLGREGEIYLVGDTPSDIRAAREVQAPIIAVATGTFTREQLLAEEPDVCVACCGDLWGICGE